VIVCEPAVSSEVVKLAFSPFNVTLLSVVVPSLKTTVPVGVPPNCGATVASNVTGFPDSDGFRDEVSVVALVALLTTCFTGFEVLAPKFASPLYVATTASVPTPSPDVDKPATPPLSVPVPNKVEPCMNVTVSPFGGAPSLEFTVAVNSMACPYDDGFGADARVVVVLVITT